MMPRLVDSASLVPWISVAPPGLAQKHPFERNRSSTSVMGVWTAVSLVLFSLSLLTTDVAAAESYPERETRTVSGWTVHIDRRLLDEEREKTDAALKMLETMLDEIVRVVPEKPVAKLKEVPLWFTARYPGVGERAEYHPGAGWLKENGRDPTMVKGVEFTNIRNFAAEVRRMPNFALHELAHAYHDRVLDFDEARVMATYKAAKEGKRYEQVERQDSEGRKSIGKHYGLTDQKEYFAEGTESFFARNDFYPYDNAELREHDPLLHKLLGEIWGEPRK